LIIFIVPKNSGLGKYKDIVKSDSAKRIEIRGEDVPSFLDGLTREKKKGVGITGEDLFVEFIENNPDAKLKVIDKIKWEDDNCIFGKPCLCLLGPKGKNLENISSGLKICVNSKYKKLFDNYAKEKLKGKDYEIFYAKGATEEFFEEGLVDLVVEIVCSGKSMRAAGLEVYGKIFLSDVVIIGNVLEDISSSLDFDKMDGLIPTILKDEFGKVLTLVYSNKESVEKSFAEWKPYFFSRSRNRICLKGSTSGNTQELLDIKKDCDSDALLFTVRQKGFACHCGEYSCFGEDKGFDLARLYGIIKKRVLDNSGNSYTRELIDNPNLLNRKIIEEAGEIVTAGDRDNLIWEISDILYFLLVKMVDNNISMKDIENENLRRDKETLLKVSGLDEVKKNGK